MNQSVSKSFFFSFFSFPFLFYPKPVVCWIERASINYLPTYLHGRSRDRKDVFIKVTSCSVPIPIHSFWINHLQPPPPPPSSPYFTSQLTNQQQPLRLTPPPTRCANATLRRTKWRRRTPRRDSTVPACNAQLKRPVQCLCNGRTRVAE